MTKEKDNKTTTTDLQVNGISDLQTSYKELADQHLSIRFANNPEFKSDFIKTFSDLVFAQNDDMQEMLPKMKLNSLLNAVFKATETGASFSNNEAYLLPFQIYKKENKGGAERKIATGEYSAVLIFDINFQKQQVLKLDNCKKFFTAEVHEGVKVIQNLATGNYEFSGENDITKPTIGYYAVFITTENVIYDDFMTNNEIIERAKSSPQYDASKYKNTSDNVHFEKIVIRNLIKDIPKVSDQLKSIIAVDEVQYSDYELVGEEDKKENTNQLEEAKKELAKPKAKPKSKKKTEKVDKATGEVTNDSKEGNSDLDDIF